MRTLKFRVWCKNKNEWEKDTILLSQYGNLYQNKNNGLIACRPDTHIIQLYTGLKDKKGKEIYEGDIVKIANQGDYRQEEEIDAVTKIIFSDGRFWCDFYGMNLNEKICSGSEGNWNMEVIGNIYENIELLTKEITYSIYL